MNLINNNTVFVATLWGGHQFGFHPVMVDLFYPAMAEELLATVLWRLATVRFTCQSSDGLGRT